MTETESFVITQDIPVPRFGGGRSKGITEALRALVTAPIGSSVFVSANKNTAAARAHTVAGAGWAVARTEGDGARVWKVADPSR